MSEIVPDPENPRQKLYTYPNGPKPFLPPASYADSCEAITEHVNRHIGPTSHVLHEIVSDKVHLDVIPVPPTDEQPYWTLVTSGMSDEPMTRAPDGAEDCQYAELLIRLPRDWPFPKLEEVEKSVWSDERYYWPVRMLKAMARFPHEYDTWIWMGHTLQVADEKDPLAPGVGFTSGLLVPPLSLPKQFWELTVSDSKKIHFFVVVPLYADETEYKRKNGLTKLLDYFGSPDGVEVIHPGRASFLAGMAQALGKPREKPKTPWWRRLFGGG